MRYIWIFCCALLALGTHSAWAQNVDIYNKELAYRIKFGRSEDVKLLLDHGADPNYVTPQGDPVLMLASGRNDPDGVIMVNQLLDKGANPNMADRSGAVPILIAATNGQRDMIARLIDKGSEFRFSSGGVPLIEIARKSGNPEAAEPIQQALDEQALYIKNAYSPDRFSGILRRYAFFGCQFQYWNYFLLSKQEPQRDTDTQKHIEASQKQMVNLLTEIATYYPKTAPNLMQSVADDSNKAVTELLDAMISNRNRAAHGVGAPGDDEKTCHGVADHLRISY